jgi:hypothetical protein
MSRQMDTKDGCHSMTVNGATAMVAGSVLIATGVVALTAGLAGTIFSSFPALPTAGAIGAMGIGAAGLIHPDKSLQDTGKLFVLSGVTLKVVATLLPESPWTNTALIAGGVLGCLSGVAVTNVGFVHALTGLVGGALHKLG